nr:hypothetical protein [Tanacetum cinerariifolium]
MTTLQFADTHNMVAFLFKPTESDGFEQIVDFLNAHPIRYALIVNPTKYISYIEQFWSIAMAKTINGKAQLHAKVDGKNIIVIKSSVRRDLRLEDEEGMGCLPNSTIFEQIALMGMIRNLDNVSGKFLNLLKGRMIDAIDADEEITLDSVHDDADKEMFNVNLLDCKEMFVAGKNENAIEEVVDAAQ